KSNCCSEILDWYQQLDCQTSSNRRAARFDLYPPPGCFAEPGVPRVLRWVLSDISGGSIILVEEKGKCTFYFPIDRKNGGFLKR
ncbi:hypothetical protein, partial [Coleofasciculus sp.]|uniref:hypothetical protein n=1 Tax=Coleofasciculus sp. TaxID=3100458 RepID=UPI003A3546C6